MPHNLSETGIKPKKRCVLVLGLHCSGTSVLSHSLAAAGFFWGEDLVGSRSTHPNGFLCA